MSEAVVRSWGGREFRVEVDGTEVLLIWKDGDREIDALFDPETAVALSAMLLTKAAEIMRRRHGSD